MQKRTVVYTLMGLLFTTAQILAEAEKPCGCPLQQAIKKLPKLQYQVGTKTTSCSKTAAKLSKSSSLPVNLIVAGKNYGTKAEALLALAEQTEGFVKKYASSKTCKNSGKTTIAGKQLECPEKATARAKLIKKAMDTVPVSYKVGNKTCRCPNEAKTLSAKSKSSVTYLVGENETNCPIQHRLNVARAKYVAAVKALEIPTRK